MVGDGLHGIMACLSPGLPKLMVAGGPDDLQSIEGATQPFARLLFGAALVGMLARWVKAPYAGALVMGGLLLEESHVTQVPDLNPTVLLFVVLPPLMFDAAFRLDARELRAAAPGASPDPASGYPGPKPAGHHVVRRGPLHARGPESGAAGPHRPRGLGTSIVSERQDRPRSRV